MPARVGMSPLYSAPDPLHARHGHERVGDAAVAVVGKGEAETDGVERVGEGGAGHAGEGAGGEALFEAEGTSSGVSIFL